MERTQGNSTGTNPARSVESTKERVGDAVREIKDSIQEAGGQTAQSAKKVVEEISSLGKEAVGNYAGDVRDQFEALEDYVREHPIRSVLMGAAAGMLISRFFRN